MPEEPLTEKRVKEIIQEYFSTRIEDVDQIRKSPAGHVLIIETEVKNLNEKIDRLDEKVDSVKNDLNERIDRLDEKVDSVKNDLNERIDRLNERIDRLDEKVDSVKSELKKEIHSSRNLSLALFLAILGLIGSVFVKILFFM